LVGWEACRPPDGPIGLVRLPIPVVVVGGVVVVVVVRVVIRVLHDSSFKDSQG
jgi:hypothetical protein